MKKGFTLVELLGVIALLGILSIVIIPKVGESLANTKETALKTQEEQIKRATSDFLVENIDLLEDNKTITIKLGTLKQKGYIPISIKNPKTKKELSNESTISVTRTNNKNSMTLELIDLEGASQTIDGNSPILVLNGNYVEYVEVNSEYTDPGATAMKSDGTSINSNNISTQVLYNNEEVMLTTNTLKTYSIVYSVTDNGKTTSATRTVTVRDSIPPSIIFPKDTVLTPSQVAGFNLKGDIIVTDNYTASNNINVTATAEGLSNVPGKYVVTYTAKDSSNNKTTEKRVIIVK